MNKNRLFNPNPQPVKLFFILMQGQKKIPKGVEILISHLINELKLFMLSQLKL